MKKCEETISQTNVSSYNRGVPLPPAGVAKWGLHAKSTAWENIIIHVGKELIDTF